MDRNDQYNDELDVRGGIDSFSDTGPDDYESSSDEFFNDTGPEESVSNQQENRKQNKYDDSEPISKKKDTDCDSCKLKIVKSRQTKDTLFGIMCVIIGLLGVMGIVVGVVVACNAYVLKPQTTVQVPQNVDPENLSVYYDPSGQMHVNIYIEKRPDLDINVNIDENGEASVETIVHDDENTTNSTSENITDTTSENTAENTTEGITNPSDETSTENQTENTTETESSDKTPIDKDSITSELEKELLDQMQQQIADGKSGYSETDTVYTVIQGDTLTKISHDTGFSVDFLAAYNHIADKNLIITGESIRYPSFNPN